jgi:hypothetical protein
VGQVQWRRDHRQSITEEMRQDLWRPVMIWQFIDFVFVVLFCLLIILLVFVLSYSCAFLLSMLCCFLCTRFWCYFFRSFRYFVTLTVPSVVCCRYLNKDKVMVQISFVWIIFSQ